MPYIKQEERLKLDEKIESLNTNIETEGQLNYVITRLCIRYLQKNGTCYKVLNIIDGVLDCAKQEFYRRFIAPYEDKKIKENGDVS